MVCTSTALETDLEQVVLDFINDVRRGMGLPLYTRDGKLDNGARCHTQLWRQVGDCTLDPHGEGHQCPSEADVITRITDAWKAGHDGQPPHGTFETAGRQISTSTSEDDYTKAVTHQLNQFMSEPVIDPSNPHNHREIIISPILSMVGIGAAVDDPTLTVRFTVDYVRP